MMLVIALTFAGLVFLAIGLERVVKIALGSPASPHQTKTDGRKLIDPSPESEAPFPHVPKRTAAFALAAVLLILVVLAACGPNFRGTLTVPLEDGRTLTCVRVGHGLSCDWGAAR